ncbi:hypothetical protein FM114_02520 [Luteococcus japonicus LSP_Lj1]|uniref:Uncharacterized protein n=1 Tax=Luteococcus japonicus LSP_Lj1 TaxID=1255658 RepID=A0A1R4ILG1_9ACTN|nr:hypothetical protein FM114_02520 [Luteococcus japonicus LSP_Lj1]
MCSDLAPYRGPPTSPDGRKSPYVIDHNSFVTQDRSTLTDAGNRPRQCSASW